MGVIPIPCVPRPEPSPEERFREEITPARAHGDELLNLTIVCLLIAAVLLPIVWWLA